MLIITACSFKKEVTPIRFIQTDCLISKIINLEKEEYKNIPDSLKKEIEANNTALCLECPNKQYLKICKKIKKSYNKIENF